MTLKFKVGTQAAQFYRVVRLRKPPAWGQVFDIVDLAAGSRPFRVRLTEARMVAGVVVYFVELW